MYYNVSRIETTCSPQLSCCSRNRRNFQKPNYEYINSHNSNSKFIKQNKHHHFHIVSSSILKPLIFAYRYISCEYIVCVVYPIHLSPFAHSIRNKCGNRFSSMRQTQHPLTDTQTINLIEF